MELKRLSFPFELKEAEDGTRTVEGFGSVFNNVDHGNDIVMPGAFAKSLKRIKSLPMLWQHNTGQPIGVWTEFEETEKGLRVKGAISDTVMGRDAHTLAKDGAVTGMSIGYFTKKYEMDKDKGTRKLIDIELYEVSLVTFPMNDKAKITRVKANGEPWTEREFEEYLREGGFSQEAVKIITAKGFKALGNQRDAGEQELTALREIAHMFNQISI